MPSKAAVVCSCGRVVRPGERCPCKAKQAQAYDQKRGSAAARGYDADWRRLREAHLSVFPLCAVCLETETIEPATDVDHIVPISVAPHRRLDPTNLQSLCHACHSRKTAMEDGGFGRKTGGRSAICRRTVEPIGVTRARDA